MPGYRVTTLTYEGSTPGRRAGWFYAYKPEGRGYEKVAGRVRELTGGEVTSFRGGYEYPREPFQVGTR